MILAAVLFVCTASGEKDDGTYLPETLDLREMNALAAESGMDMETVLKALISGNPDIGIKLSESVREAIRNKLSGFKQRIPLMVTPVLYSVMLRMMMGKRMSECTAFQLVCRLMLVGILSAVFADTYIAARDFLEDIMRCVDVMTPVMVAVTAITGADAWGAALTPGSAIVTDMIQSLFSGAGLTLIAAAAVTAAVGNLSKSVSLKRLHGLVKQTIQWGIGFLMTGFMGMLNIQGKLAAGRDSVTVRSVRYTVESVIPMIGGNVADSLGSVIASASTIRNAVGAAGLIVLICRCIGPLIGIGMEMMLMKLLSALTEPLGDETMTSMLGQFGDACELLLVLCIAAVLLCALLVGSCMTSVGSLFL